MAGRSRREFDISSSKLCGLDSLDSKAQPGGFIGRTARTLARRTSGLNLQETLCVGKDLENGILRQDIAVGENS